MNKVIHVQALLDSKVSTCILDEGFVQQHDFLLIQKSILIPIEVIDGKPLALGDIMHEIVPLELMTTNHLSKIAFNVIKFVTKPIILGLSWLEKFNPQINWKTRKIDFLLSSTSTCSQKVATKSTITLKESKQQRPLFIGAKAFMQATKKRTLFAIYAKPSSKPSKASNTIPKQYEEFKDISKKKNANIVPKHCLYDCTIDLEDGTKPLFWPIYNLL